MDIGQTKKFCECRIYYNNAGPIKNGESLQKAGMGLKVDTYSAPIMLFKGDEEVKETPPDGYMYHECQKGWVWMKKKSLKKYYQYS